MPPPKIPRHKFPATCVAPPILQESESGASLLVATWKMASSLSSREGSFLVSLGKRLMSLMVYTGLCRYQSPAAGHRCIEKLALL